MFWLKHPKCQGCGRDLKTQDDTTEIRLDTKDGITTMTVCESCGDFWEKSQELFKKRNYGSFGTQLEDY